MNPIKQYFDRQFSFLKSSFFEHYIKSVYNKMIELDLLLFGGGLAFSLFVCMLPLILLFFSLLGNVLEIASFENKISLFLDAIIPYKENTQLLKKIIFDRVEEAKNYRNIAGYLGLIGLLFAASGLFSTMRSILNKVFQVKKTSSLLFGKLRDFLMIFIVLVFFLLSTTILPIVEILKSNTDKIQFLHFLKLNAIIKFIFSLASFFIIFWLFYLLYYFVPCEKQPAKVVSISAFIAAFLWVVAELLFGFYISNFAALGNIYGTYVFIIVIAFWIYYSSVIFIISAEIGELYKEKISLINRPDHKPEFANQ